MRTTNFIAISVLSLSSMLAVPTLAQVNSREIDQRDAARRQAVNQAQGQVDRMTAAVQASRERIRANWKANPELTAIENEIKAKQQTLDKARQDALTKLKDSKEYKTATSDLQALGEPERPAEVVAVNPGATTQPTTMPAPSAQQITSARLRLEGRTKVATMEKQAYAADDSVRKAEADVASSQAKLDALNAQLEATLLNDPEYKAQMDQLQNAKANLSAASAQY